MPPAPPAAARMAAQDAAWLRSLQTCFGALREQHQAWKKTLAACTPLLASLANLAEQMEASRKVALASPRPLRDFPSLPERIQRKQRSAAEALLEELQEQLADLQKAQHAVGLHVAGLSQQARGLGLESSLRRSACSPSVADLLEWVLDVERFYHRTYLEAKLLLLPLSYENLTSMQALPQAWQRVLNHSLQNVVEDTLLKVAFFLEAT
ncbi:ribosome biogenesis protein C1orf109 homolog isoform X2 [Hemicordylus capensis]|uniref:ribosome biogenesis protein C1orf109 homolog isoform X2 n=1 Tax=Hemicordylus capensis TaxID=884348 RepID=UPI002302C0E6|nr:ribosome biogenesis protein C1orf109 homolog isoform X2 [Hemicordylus capensis]